MNSGNLEYIEKINNFQCGVKANLHLFTIASFRVSFSRVIGYHPDSGLNVDLFLEGISTSASVLTLCRILLLLKIFLLSKACVIGLFVRDPTAYYV